MMSITRTWSVLSHLKSVVLTAALVLVSIEQSEAQYAGIDTGGGVVVGSEESTGLATRRDPSASGASIDLSDEEPPFGANLFSGGFASEKRDGLNPDYIISQGDRVELRVWGATEINESLIVDPKGNVFIPRVGPVRVAGVRNELLNESVTAAVREVYTENVQVYTSLSSSQPVAVYVTGFVTNPGRYVGVASNSILYFIDRAAGIDPDNGSFRRIDILRGGRRIATADLYEFLLSGKLPALQLKDGDTILVKPRGDTVSVSGDVRNPAVFELTEKGIDGVALVRLARPRAGSTHALWEGIHNGAPTARYLSIDEIESQQFGDGDHLELLSDAHAEVITVRVEGAFEGQSRFVIDRSTRLGDLLDMIAVPRDLAATEAVSIRRKSIREQQKITIEESLRRLESSHLLASSQTNEEASIRATEARLISEFVDRVRQAEPMGRLVLGDNGSAAQLRLQDGDVITIPARSETILIAGEILIPQAILFEETLSLEDYIAQSGGFTDQADPEHVLLIRQNGEALLAENNRLQPGDQILILPSVPNKYLQFAASIVDVMFKAAVSAGVLVNVW